MARTGLQRIARPRAHRDATLVVISTEDSKRTPHYLNALRVNLQFKRKVKMLVLPSNNGSNCSRVVDQLTDYKKRHSTLTGDQFWAVVDVDSHHDLQSACNNALNQQFRLAVSNPCVEVWLALHRVDCVSCAITSNARGGPREMKRLWGALLRQRNEDSPSPSETFPSEDETRRATARARDNSQSDPSRSGFLPGPGCTDFYLLLEELVQ